MCRLRSVKLFSKTSRELVYSSPIDAPFKLTYDDISKVGDIEFYQGESGVFIIQDMLSEFLIIEEVTEISSLEFAKFAMKVILGHDLCHTFVVDKNSKFMAIFKPVMSTLKINLHITSGGNDDAIMVKRFNSFLNKYLRIYSNERDTAQSFVKGAQMIVYTSISTPVAETYISRSLVAMRR